MSNNKAALFGRLQVLGLSLDEAKVYVELLGGSATHLRLAQVTGINRTKVYRLVDRLEERGLITRQVDDRGLALVATDPATLEIEIAAQEESAKRRRAAFQSLLPQLDVLRSATEFSVNVYTDARGFKQMLWHELKAQGEVLVLGGCLLQELVESPTWAEQYRVRVAGANYHTRELVNREFKYEGFTSNSVYASRYDCRRLPRETLNLGHATAIYNDTVSAYYWRAEQKVGVEVTDPSYAQAMRQIFNRYWDLAA